MDGLKSIQEDFEVDPEFEEAPVKLLEDGSHLVKGEVIEILRDMEFWTSWGLWRAV